MNILFITALNPLNATYGGEQRTHLLWESLKKRGNVYTLVVLGGAVPTQEDVVNKIRTVSADSPSRLFKALDRLLLRIGFGCRFPWHTKKNIEKLMGWPSVKFDAVVCRYMTAAAITSAWKIASCYIDIDDYPPAKVKSLGEGRFKKFLVNVWTHYILRKCRGAWIPDASQIPEISKYTRCLHLPNLARLPSANYRVDAPQKMQLMTVGLMYYTPNYEGVDWFVTNIWPAIKAKYPEMTYKIAGKGAPADLAAKWGKAPGVSVLGFVDDLEALYAESLAVVAPIFKGAGTCIKVMEAATYGRTCFATPFAVRGYEQHLAMVFDCSEGVLGLLENLMSKPDRGTFQMGMSSEAKKLNSVELFKNNVKALLHD